MNNLYEKINWTNATPLSVENLNKMDAGIKALDEDCARNEDIDELASDINTKTETARQASNTYTDQKIAEVNASITNITNKNNTQDSRLTSLESKKHAKNISLNLNTDTGILEIQLVDDAGNALGDKQSVDFPLEMLVENASYDAATKQISLTFRDTTRTPITINVADLVDTYTGEIDWISVDQNVIKLTDDIKTKINQAHVHLNKEILDSITALETVSFDEVDTIEAAEAVIDLAATQGSTNLISSGAVYTAINSHSSNNSNPHNVTKAQVGLGNVDNTSDLDKPISNATQSALNAKQDNLSDAQLSAVNSGITADYVSKIDSIEEKIPTQASVTNKLADKDFVNSSIATNTATYRGTFNSTDLLPTSDVDNNDYAFVTSVGSNGNTIYTRYKYNGTTWVSEYIVNNSGFTSEQWSSVNSGITAEKTNTYDAHTNNTANPHNVTKTQVGLGNVDNTSDLNKPISTATQSALDGKLNTSNVVQAKGTSTLNVMSQKVVTDELFKKANASDVIKKSASSTQVIQSNGSSTVINFKTTATGGAHTAYADSTGHLGYFGFDGNKGPVVYRGDTNVQEKVLTNKTLPIGGQGYSAPTITGSGMTTFEIKQNGLLIRLFGSNNEYCQIFGRLWFKVLGRTASPIITLTTDNLVTDNYQNVGTAIFSRHQDLSETLPPLNVRPAYIRCYGNKIQICFYETYANTADGIYCLYVPLTTFRLK